MDRYAIFSLLVLIPGSIAISCYTCGQYGLEEKCAKVEDCTRDTETQCYVAIQERDNGTQYYQSGCAIADPDGCTCEQAGCSLKNAATDLQCCEGNDCNAAWTSEDDKTDEADKEDDKEDDSSYEDGENEEGEGEAVKDKASSALIARFSLSALFVFSLRLFL